MIKCFEPNLTAADIDAVLKVLETKVLAFGSNVSQFEEGYKKFSKKKYNIGFNSASSAAYLLYQYLYEKHGPCRVYTPSNGFVSPVYAAIKNGHEVVFVDVDDDLLLDMEKLKNKIIRDNKKTIVMPVLYGGVSGIREAYEVCKEESAILVLDSAHCISPTMKYDYAFYSFHPVKPVCMSNGGLLSTDDKEASEYMYSCRNFGRVQRGDSYDILHRGFNFYMNNLNASLGLSQLDRCLANADTRRANFAYLRDGIPRNLGRFVEHDVGSSYYLSTLVLRPGDSSVIMRKYLRERGVEASFHYPFLHKSTAYAQRVTLPVLESLEDRIINLPIHQQLEQEQLEKIVNECIHYSRSRRQSQ